MIGGDVSKIYNKFFDVPSVTSIFLHWDGRLLEVNLMKP